MDSLHPSAGVGSSNPPALSAQTLIDEYQRVRAFSEQLCEPLEIEDYTIQSMPDASPAKWHLAHVSWFFEEFERLAAGAGLSVRAVWTDPDRLFSVQYLAVEDYRVLESFIPIVLVLVLVLGIMNFHR